MLATGDAATSRLSEVEVASALARRVREGDIAPGRGDDAIAALAGDLQALYVVELVPEVTARARALLRRRALRAVDAVQLASCLFLGERLAEPVPMVTFDDRLRAAARAERIRVLPSRLGGHTPRRRARRT